jgi:hypothetical protein
MWHMSRVDRNNHSLVKRMFDGDERQQKAEWCTELCRCRPRVKRRGSVPAVHSTRSHSSSTVPSGALSVSRLPMSDDVAARPPRTLVTEHCRTRTPTLSSAFCDDSARAAGTP